MVIKEINAQSNFKSATVTLFYNELREIANGLYELSQMEFKRDLDFHKCHRNMSFLFNLVKHGTIDSASIQML